MKSLLFFVSLALLTASCLTPAQTLSPITLDKQLIELHYDEQYQFTLKQDGKDVSTAGFTWSSSDPSVGTIDINAKFKAKRIGETTIKGFAVGQSVPLESKVTVIPYSTLCREPFVGFGSDKSPVKSFETRALSQEDAWSYICKGENGKLRYVLYHFEANKLTSAALLLNSAGDIPLEAATFLNDRYSTVVTKNGTTLFTDAQKVYIGLKTDSLLGLVILYIPYQPVPLTDTELLAQVDRELERIKN